MKNKTVIRKKLENGKFTTIHNSILFDTRLTPNAFRLITAILSDSDTNFDLSQTLYCDRLKITKKTFFRAIDNLIECGYLKKTEVDKGVSIPNIKKANSDKKVYHYTISEYGNLKPELEIQPENDTKSVELTDDELQIEKCKDFLRTNRKILVDNDFVYPLTIEAFENGNYDIAFYQTFIDDEKEIEKLLKQYYKDVLGWIQDIIKPDRPKALIDFQDWLKDEVFNKRNTNLERVSVRSKYSKLSLIKHGKKYKTDYETEMGDYYENPRD
ncbi:helix-turn-helix domain-containing protein [Flavobacterium sp. N1719]|uniref:helix-turn-helix domain-containing protein n=1 Tax=Flavobacterium sp. N1719 TaxID=2885633 RepID=UPI002221AA4A|nr:helix-turn-helix domain-containing protein [Flavobacterium sp. N1719]